MSPWVAFVLALRVLGVFALAEGFAGTVTAGAWVFTLAAQDARQTESLWQMAIGAYATPGAWLLAGAILLLQAPWIADRWDRRVPGANERESPRGEELLEVGVRLLAVYTLVRGLSHGLSAVSALLQEGSPSGYGWDWVESPLPASVQFAGHTVVAALLWMGPRRVVAWTRRHFAPAPPRSGGV